MIFLFLFSSLVFADDLNVPVHAPTIKLEKTPRGPLRPVKPKGPVFIDARPAFDYAMGHLPLALPIRLQDFNQTGEGHKGALDPDLDMLGRKLRVMGISPDREVVIYGLGAKGNGEEGRVAWMLSYLGIKKIVLQNLSRLQEHKTTDTNVQNASSPIWLVHANENLRARRQEVEKAVSEKSLEVVFIDVRSADAFKAKHIPGAVNIDWKLFNDGKDEMAYPELVKKILTDHHVDLGKTLIFYSGDGVESGYVTFAALRAGLHAKNYDGSFSEWTLDSHNPTAP